MRRGWANLILAGCIVTGATLAVFVAYASTSDITVAQMRPGGRFGGPNGQGEGGPEAGPPGGFQGPGARGGARQQGDAPRPIPPRDALSIAALDAAPISAVPIIDVHAHMRPTAGKQGGVLSNVGGQDNFEDSVTNAASQMRQFNVAAAIIMPPPNPEGRGFEVNAYAWAFANHPGLIAGGGGGTLNAMIEHAVRTGELGPQIVGPFRQMAERMAHSGIAVLGEFASEHFSLFAGHPYEENPPDHPLFMILADIAAQNDLPIDLHMEALPEDMDMPDGFHLKASANPPTVKGNIAALERLLNHNPSARIVWAHAGWDNTGYWTVDLSRRLLAAHPNLYMSLKLSREAREESRPMDGSRHVRPEWIALFRAFPDRFVIGSDSFFNAGTNIKSSDGDGSLSESREFIDALPEDLRRPIAYANAVRIYNLDKPARRMPPAGN